MKYNESECLIRLVQYSIPTASESSRKGWLPSRGCTTA